MASRRLAVLGSGNVRTSPRVLATLATYFPDEPLEVRLFDCNEERLDLLDRLGRTCFEATKVETILTSTNDLTEALEGATEILVTLHEDCARRMIGGSTTPPIYDSEVVDRFEWRFGDRNKPTPPQNLCDHTRTIISVPAAVDLQGDELMATAVTIAWDQAPAGSRWLALMTPEEVQKSEIPTSDWPGEMSQGQETAMAYQILRWVQHDEKIQDLLEESRKSPLRNWLLEAE